MHIAEVVTIAKSLPLLRLNTYKSLILSYSVDYRRIFLKKLNEEIEKHMADENFSVESLADIFSLSRSSLQRKVKIISGTTPGEYLRNYRLKRACHLLLESNMRINEVAFEVGFNSASYFTKAFFKAYNMTPTDFLAEHAPEKADRQMQGTASGKSTDRN